MGCSSIFVVATGQDIGKTTVSLGLMNLLKNRGFTAGFMKPVGQQYVELNGDRKVDKDAVLMQVAMGAQGDLVDMSPILAPRGFVQEYIFNPNREPLLRRLREAYDRLAGACDVLIVEGTGHAGVGSCFDLSNAAVAAHLGLKVLLVGEGGIGSTLDQVALNLAMFERSGVETIGVIANKVIPEKRDYVSKFLRQGLANMGQRFLGAIPYDDVITQPHVAQVAKTLKAEILCGEARVNQRVKHILVAAMEPQNVLPRIKPGSLMITPGDRIDNILVALELRKLHQSSTFPDEQSESASIVGLILTGGFLPHFTIVDLLKRSDMPVLMCKEDTYRVTSHVQGMVYKMLPEDTDKIERVERLIAEFVEFDPIISAMGIPDHGVHTPCRG